MAFCFGLSREESAIVRSAALLHDLGKIETPLTILEKPGPLQPAERVLMDRHAAAGERLLQDVPACERLALIVGQHHERFDGSGYPRGLAGAAIDPAARIVTVADAFVAMIEDRPYSQRRSRVDALAEVRRCSGTQFDAAAVAALFASEGYP